MVIIDEYIQKMALNRFNSILNYQINSIFGDDLFNLNRSKEKVILIDVNNFLLLFFEDLKQIYIKFKWIPNYHLLKIFDCLYQKLFEVHFNLITFYADSDFYIYLLPEREKSKIIRIIKYTKNFFSYSAKQGEFEYFKERLKGKIFLEANNKRSFETQFLFHGVYNKFKLFSNNTFNHEYYRFIQDYISKNRYSFKIENCIITIINEKNEKIIDPFPLIDLPDDIQEKFKQIKVHIPQKKENNLTEISNFNNPPLNYSKTNYEQPNKIKINNRGRPKKDINQKIENISMLIHQELLKSPKKYEELRNIIKVNHQVFQTAFKTLQETHKIEKDQNFYWRWINY